MATTYEPIASTTLGSAAASITFSSIPATFTDLKLTIVFTSTGTISHRLGFNNDTSSSTNYSNTLLTGNGTTAASVRATSQNGIRWASHNTGVSSTTPQLANIDIFSYLGTTNKTVLIEGSGDNNGSGYVDRVVGLWRNTSAISTINLYFLDATQFNAGTTATLYGIKNA